MSDAAIAPEMPVEPPPSSTTVGASVPPQKIANAVTKVIVAVHGVGDQQNYATIQSVVNQFCGYWKYPAAVPLGNFHTGTVTYTIQHPYPSQPFGSLAFAEVYWADIPRAVVAGRYSLEEAKKWSRTIVERMQLHHRITRSEKNAGENSEITDTDFTKIKTVLGEMIESIAVVEQLSMVARKMGLFTFDVRALLDDYLGDVQVVTEFGEERDEILGKFSKVMGDVHTVFPNAEIYIVAHSEGTVVTFLSLLKAFASPALPEWANRVRGMMTIGSPIDKHLLLWPDLFNDTSSHVNDSPMKPRHFPDRKIEWRNYYDYGDPIGFNLDEARIWLHANGWENVFNFSGNPKDGHDNGFARYPYPGKAHVDYWNDDAVFGHFIQTVVDPQRELKLDNDTGNSVDYNEPPHDLRGKQLFTNVMPYIGILALLATGSYLLFKAFNQAVPEEAQSSTLQIVRGVVGLVGLLFGMTVATRIPRLTGSAFWRGAAIGAGILLAGAYVWSVWPNGPKSMLGVNVPPGGLTITLALVIVLIVRWLNRIRPDWGLKPLIFLGSVAVLGRVAYRIFDAHHHQISVGSFWPVALALAAFLYFWWLSALMFDLVFVWHLYIRNAKVIEWMQHAVGRRATSAPPATKTPATSSQQVTASAA